MGGCEEGEHHFQVLAGSRSVYFREDPEGAVVYEEALLHSMPPCVASLVI